jgi:hypothetical protein
MNAMSMKVLGMAALMGLVGCAAEAEGESTQTTAQAATADTTKTIHTVTVEICEGVDVPTLDPFFGAFIEASLNQDPTQPRVSFDAMRRSGEVATNIDLPGDAVIEQIEFPAFDSTAVSLTPAKLTLKLASATASTSATSHIACAVPFPLPVYAYQVVAVDEAGSTVLDTTRARYIGPTIVSFAADGSYSLDDLDLTLPADNAAGLRPEARITARIDKLPRTTSHATSLSNTLTSLPTAVVPANTKYTNVKLTRPTEPTAKLPGRTEPATLVLKRGKNGAMSTEFFARVGELTQ